MNTEQALAADKANLVSLQNDDEIYTSVTFKIVMKKVESSNIRAIGHIKPLGLVVAFHSGGIYCYPSLGPELAQQLVEAPSVGKLFHACVKSLDVPFIQLQ